MGDDPRLQPFELGQGDQAVLLLHGYTGTPHEMRYLGERLAEEGWRVLGVRLTGHGLDPEELARARPDDWVRDARQGLETLAGARRVFVAGLSVGALLSILLAAERPERISGIALLAPALRFRGAVRFFVRAFRPAWVRRVVRFVPKGGSAIWDSQARRDNPTVAKVPTVAAGQLVELIARAEAALPKVRAPAFVAYSDFDPTVAPAAAFEIARRIGSQPVEMLRLRNSFHVVTIDRDRDRVAAGVDAFFRRCPLSPVP